MDQFGRLLGGPDRSRKVLEISEIEGYRNGKIIINPIFKYKINKMDSSTGKLIAGELAPTGNKLINTTKLEINGVIL
jgi:pilus assembly protein CpaF